MNTFPQTEILGRDGQTKSDMLAWFRRNGFWEKPDDGVFRALCQLNALQLDLIAEAVKYYGIQKCWEGNQKSR